MVKRDKYDVGVSRQSQCHIASALYSKKREEDSLVDHRARVTDRRIPMYRAETRLAFLRYHAARTKHTMAWVASEVLNV